MKHVRKLLLVMMCVLAMGAVTACGNNGSGMGTMEDGVDSAAGDNGNVNSATSGEDADRAGDPESGDTDGADDRDSAGKALDDAADDVRDGLKDAADDVTGGSRTDKNSR